MTTPASFPTTERPRRWTAEELWERSSWRIDAPLALAEDLAALRSWAEGRDDPLAELELSEVDLQHVRPLARQIEEELATGSGVCWIRGVPPTGSLELRLLFVAIGLCMGRPVGAYGRLYDVKDSGRSHYDEAIPVSQTRASPGLHTDSSNKGICPRYIGLLCIHPASEGGTSRVSSALQAHERLRISAPEDLSRLYVDHIRDLVTPGAVRNADTIRTNAFPIFATPPAPSFRYMRYWIERGQELAGSPLSSERVAVLDRLDAQLMHPEHLVEFRLEAGHMLFCDNTTIAHDRDAYVSDPDRPRWLCRLWIQPASAGR